MATVELATSLAFRSNLSSSLLALEVLASQAFGVFVLDCSDCQIFNKDHHICQMYNIVLFRLQLLSDLWSDFNAILPRLIL
jgi:hypothetical protein